MGLGLDESLARHLGQSRSGPFPERLEPHRGLKAQVIVVETQRFDVPLNFSAGDRMGVVPGNLQVREKEGVSTDHALELHVRQSG